MSYMGNGFFSSEPKNIQHIKYLHAISLNEISGINLKFKRRSLAFEYLRVVARKSAFSRRYSLLTSHGKMLSLPTKRNAIKALSLRVYEAVCSSQH